MGYEFLIKANLTVEQKGELTKLFERKPNYSFTVTINGEEHFEFKEISNQSQMPDFTTAFNGEGIYVCQNQTADVWANLLDLKEHLLKQKIEFDVEEL